MKQRFSSIDVKAIVHELEESLVGLRLSNVYDLSSKIMLFKFAKPDNKRQLVVDAGFRCHMTDFARTTATEPSAFVKRLRKSIKTRRLTSVTQTGTDRVIEFQFSQGQFRLFLEFFAGGNVILTDAELNIMALLRIVREGEAQEPVKVGLKYDLTKRQNYEGVPPLTNERLREALEISISKAEKTAAAGKKIKIKPGDNLRKGMASTISEVPPVVLDHCLLECDFDVQTSLPDILSNDQSFEKLFKALQDAIGMVEGIAKGGLCNGYIIAKRKPGQDSSEAIDSTSPHKRGILLYDDFHPFLPAKFKNNPDVEILSFDSFNKTVDTFYSSIEGQKLESRLTDKEAAARRKLEATKTALAKNIEGLVESQHLNVRKASAILANVERVQEAIEAVNDLLQEGMDWVDIGKLIEREQQRSNPVASVIKLPLKLEKDTITLLLAEEVEEEEDEGYLTESSVSEDEDEDTSTKGKAADSRLAVDIILSLTPWANAGQYFDEKRTAAAKEGKTVSHQAKALKSVEAKIKKDLKKGLKLEKPVLQLIRKPLWFEKFIWFISSDGYLVLGAKDAIQGEMLYRRHLRKGDIFCHSDVRGASIIVIKNNPTKPDAPMPPSTLSQAGTLCICTSDAWDSKAGFGAWWVAAEQVSKMAAGQVLGDGLFHVTGEKNHLPPPQLVVGVGLVFKVSEGSKSAQARHRIYEGMEGAPAASGESEGPEKSLQDSEDGEDVDDVEDEISRENQAVGAREDRINSPEGREQSDEDEEDHRPRLNPLHISQERDHKDDGEALAAGVMASLSLEKEQAGPSVTATEQSPRETPTPSGHETGNAEEEDEEAPTSPAESSVPFSSRTSVTGGGGGPTGKKGPAKRGQKAKAKKMATKYKHQDDEDRAAAEALLGAAAGRRKAEEEARAKAQREAEAAEQLARRKALQEKRQKQTAAREAAREAARRKALDEGGDGGNHDEDDDDDDEKVDLGVVDRLVGTPLPGDEILTAMPTCAPYGAMARCKYKVKMQPGAVKRGKAAREVLDRWMADAGRKGVVDEQGEDPERMWPREVGLIRGLRSEDFVNVVPVGKVRVMMQGGGGGGGGGGSKGQQGKGGGRGGKGGKK